MKRTELNFCSFPNFYLILLMSLVSCTQSSQEDRGYFRAYLGSEPQTFDWHISTDRMAGLVNINTMEGLFSYDLSSNKVKLIPQLAQTFSHDKSFKNWKICTHNDQLWSDGKPLKAKHFVDAWQRLLNPQTGSPHSHHFWIIKNAKNFYENRVSFKKVGLKENDNCLSIELEQSYPEFLHTLTAPFSYPIRIDKILEHPMKWTLPKNWVGLGPYIPKQSNRSRLSLEKNKYYKNHIAIENIEIYWLDDKNTALNLYNKNKLDFIYLPNEFNLTTQQSKSELNKIEGIGTYLLFFNFKKPIVQNFLFRKTIKDSINRETLEKASMGQLLRSDRLIPTTLFDTFSKNETPPTAVISKKSGDNSIIQIKSNHSDLHKVVLESLGNQISNNTNFTINLDFSGTAQYFNQLNNEIGSELFRLSYTPAILSPSSYFVFFSSESKLNYGKYYNKLVDKKIKQSLSEKDTGKRENLYKNIENIIFNEDIAAIPLMKHVHAYIIKNKYQLKPHFSERIEFRSLKTLSKP